MKECSLLQLTDKLTFSASSIQKASSIGVWVITLSCRSVVAANGRVEAGVCHRVKEGCKALGAMKGVMKCR